MDDTGRVYITKFWHLDLDELHLLLLQDLNTLIKLQHLLLLQLLLLLYHLYHQYNQSVTAVVSIREALTSLLEKLREAPPTAGPGGRPTLWMSRTT